MTSSFRNLRKDGPYELAIMPIGAYQPWINSHCTPEQAVQMTEDAGAKHLLPVHFKTFPFGREGTAEPHIHLFSFNAAEVVFWSLAAAGRIVSSEAPVIGPFCKLAAVLQATRLARS